MSLKEQGVTLWVNDKEVEELEQLEYSITREGTPITIMGTSDLRSFSRGRSLPSSIKIDAVVVALRKKWLPFGHLNPNFYASSLNPRTKDEMEIKINRDGIIGTLQIKNLVLENYRVLPVPLDVAEDDLRWELSFSGQLAKETSTPDVKTASNEQLLSMLRTFEDDEWEMKL